MYAPSSSDPEFFAQKTDVELLFLAQHPELYHADLVSTARRELRRRGVSPNPTPAEPQPIATHLPAYNDDDEPSLWQRPSLWMGVLAMLLLAGGWYWSNQRAEQRRQAAQAADVGPPVLKSVETHLIPAFDSLTRTQIAQELRQLPAAERTRDTAATRKYRLLAERYWKAENQSAYLLKQIQTAPAPDSARPGQTTVVEEEWRRLTKALVYNHGLTPVLAERMDLMRRAAYLRIETLQGISGRFQAGQPMLDKQMVVLRDSATAMREALLSRGKWNAQLMRSTSL